MSEKIDWSKAPEGCIGAFTSKHDFRSVGFSSFFVITKRYSDYGAQAGCSGEDQDGKEYHVFEKYWDYHEKPASWSGEGLPPVGAVCEVRNAPGGWGKAVITHQGKGLTVWLWHSENPDQVEYAEIPDRLEFRQIRTPEQIAADEREAVVNEMHKLYIQGAKHHGGLYAIYDAGFRKP